MNWDDYKNFSKWEFDCTHTGKNKMQSQFLDILQQIRNTFGKPMVVNSGYRDFTHPLERLKERYGEHTYGAAADIEVKDVDAGELFTIAFEYGIRRLGLYQNNNQHFLHIGIGDRELNFKPTVWTP